MSDKVLIQTLSAVGVSTVNGPGWFDLSSYVSGAFYVVVTVGGTLTPTFNMSPDNGVTALGAIPAGELAAPAGQVGAGAKRYPLIGVAQLPWVQVSSVITVSAVTGTVFFYRANEMRSYKWQF
jgi:hypothetical protein